MNVLNKCMYPCLHFWVLESYFSFSRTQSLGKWRTQFIYNAIENTSWWLILLGATHLLLSSLFLFFSTGSSCSKIWCRSIGCIWCKHGISVPLSLLLFAPFFFFFFSISYNSSELYKYFNISYEEIKYIEEHIWRTKCNLWSLV